MPSLPDAIVPMNCFGDLPASWHPADQGAAFTVGCGGIKQDIGFRFRAGTGVCPVPETIDPQPLLQPVETFEPREHGKGAAECAGSRTAFTPASLGEGGAWISPTTAILSASTCPATGTWLVREDWISAWSVSERLVLESQGGVDQVHVDLGQLSPGRRIAWRARRPFSPPSTSRRSRPGSTSRPRSATSAAGGASARVPTSATWTGLAKPPPGPTSPPAGTA